MSKRTNTALKYMERVLGTSNKPSTLLFRTAVRVGGEIAGRVTSGGYGYTVGRSIAYAYLPAEFAAVGTEVDVEVFGARVGAVVSSEPLFDPSGARVRG